MMKSILAAATLALAASAIPAAAYEGEHRHHKPSVGRTMTKTYTKPNSERNWDSHRYEVREHHEGRRWWHRRHHWNGDYAENHEHRRHRRWWHYWN